MPPLRHCHTRSPRAPWIGLTMAEPESNGRSLRLKLGTGKAHGLGPKLGAPLAQSPMVVGQVDTPYGPITSMLRPRPARAFSLDHDEHSGTRVLSRRRGLAHAAVEKAGINEGDSSVPVSQSAE